MNNMNISCGCNEKSKNMNTLCACNKEVKSMNTSCNCDKEMKNINKECSCTTPLENNKKECPILCSGDNIGQCKYSIDEDTIFLPDLENEVENFTLKPIWKEFCINGSVSVPLQKLSIEEIDSINADVQIISQKVIEVPAVYNLTTHAVTDTVTNEEGKITTGRKLIVEGIVCVTVSYVSLCKDQSVNSFHGQVPFSTFIVLPKDTSLNTNFEVYSLIEEICVKEVCDRKINLTFAVILTAEKTKITECGLKPYKNSGLDCSKPISCIEGGDCFNDQPVIKGICTSGKIENLIKSTKENLWTEISVPELLTIPKCKPNVTQILTISSTVNVMCQNTIITPVAVTNYEGEKLTGLKLLIHAILRQRITYVSDRKCHSVHAAHFDVPISAYIVLPSTASQLSKYRIRTCIEDLYACALNSRQIFKNTTLFFKAEPII